MKVMYFKAGVMMVHFILGFCFGMLFAAVPMIIDKIFEGNKWQRKH